MKKRIKKSTQTFRKEFFKSLNTALIAAFGLIIALTWNDVVKEYVETLVKFSPVQGKLIIAIFITLISVIAIILITRLAKPKDE